ncbi:SAF domain-containing protein [Planomicrobium okeanokoites]|uniref:SAF domain-containing protein n=1 Tax=Planomicrobium okeanokoites TaxID=244 RepID=UPI002493A964|nr:SAF domain-containing protein [Planomicrobium okeanokoites]
MKSTMNVLLALVFVGLGVGFVFFFEFYLTEKIDTVEVVVAKETIDFKTLITEENIEIANVKRGTEVANAIPVTAYESLVGKYASIKIEKGTQLYTDLIDTYNLVPNSEKGEFVAPIPKEWLFAVPGSLRRTYVADVYAINDADQRLKRDLANAAAEQGDLPESAIQSIEPGAKPILTSVRVASVKDSGNREVTESVETNEATGQVAALEIIATDEMLETMTNALNDGFKLYVVYKFERSNEMDPAEVEEVVAEEAIEEEDVAVEEEEIVVEEDAAETVSEESDEETVQENPEEDTATSSEVEGEEDGDESADE